MLAFAVLLLLAVAFVLYARGGGPVPRPFEFLSPGAGELLQPSGPEEQVLRSLRLAGVERAIVGEERGSALVRVEIPSVTTGADVEIVWQTAVASLATAYPRADEYVVQLFADGTPFAEMVVGPGGEVREAVESGDAAALSALAEVALLPEEGGGDE